MVEFRGRVTHTLIGRYALQGGCRFMEILLKLKSWQMFLLIVTPMVLPSMIGVVPHLVVFFITWLLWMSVLLGWIYSVGIKANSLVPDSLKKKHENIEVFTRYTNSLLNCIFSFNPK